MKKIILIINILLLSSCSSAKFDSFNPTTSTLKWIITNDKKVTSDVVKFVLIKNIQEPVLIDFSINDLLEVLTNA